MNTTDTQTLLRALSTPSRRRLATAVRVTTTVAGMVGNVPPIAFVGRLPLLAELKVDDAPGEVLSVSLGDFGHGADEAVAFCARRTALRRLSQAASCALDDRSASAAATLLQTIASVSKVIERADPGTLYVVIDESDEAVAVYTIHVDATDLSPTSPGGRA